MEDLPPTTSSQLPQDLQRFTWLAHPRPVDSNHAGVCGCTDHHSATVMIPFKALLNCHACCLVALITQLGATQPTSLLTPLTRIHLYYRGTVTAACRPGRQPLRPFWASSYWCMATPSRAGQGHRIHHGGCCSDAARQSPRCGVAASTVGGHGTCFP